MNADTLRALALLTSRLQDLEADRLLLETIDRADPANAASLRAARDRGLARWKEIYAAQRRIREAVETDLTAQRDRWNDTLWGVTCSLSNDS